MAFSHYVPRSVRVKVTIVDRMTGIYEAPEDAAVRSVIKMALPDFDVRLLPPSLLDCRAKDGDSVTLTAASNQLADISLDAMNAREKLLLGVPLDLNAMKQEEWELLPGIGPVLAARILADRQANGDFASLDDLHRVTGVGQKTLERLRTFF